MPLTDKVNKDKLLKNKSKRQKAFDKTTAITRGFVMKIIRNRCIKYYITAIIFFTGILFISTVAIAADKPPVLPNIKILATGGTIAGSASSSTETKEYKPGVLDISTLIKAVPGLEKIANISGEQIANISSSNMNNEIMLKLALRVNELLSDKGTDGIVITHGTDTMEETAYFLNLTVKSAKPVVVVGSMRPATAISADGPLNLYNAVVLAANKTAKEKGVLVALNERIHGARDVAKTNTTAVDTFKSPEFGCLGFVMDGKVFFYRTTTRRHTANTEFAIDFIKTLPRVDILYGHENGTGDFVEAAVKAGAQGIVHAGSGDGSIFSTTKEALREAGKMGVIVVRSSRVGSGMVTHTADDGKDGFVTSDTLNPQKARILLMLALTKTSDIKKIQQFFDEY